MYQSADIAAVVRRAFHRVFMLSARSTSVSPVGNGTPALWVSTCRIVVQLAMTGGRGQASQRVVEREVSALDEHVYNGRRDRLGRRVHAERGVSRHRTFGIGSLVGAFSRARSQRLSNAPAPWC